MAKVISNINRNNVLPEQKSKTRQRLCEEKFEEGAWVIVCVCVCVCVCVWERERERELIILIGYIHRI